VNYPAGLIASFLFLRSDIVAGGLHSPALVTINGCDDPVDDISISIDPKKIVLFHPAIDWVEGMRANTFLKTLTELDEYLEEYGYRETT
tara:strand:- start:981 stop:1247 length:267 start_codon:yes stop_codon:yes gene_type:complete